ncbi:radical SAM/SPASM domain-containing protein [Nonomuraea sp. CA-141351]|uniref:radical SAM protein n=1 Tax=Nonomuraea sp. CA-141351 TaxID=3239996 RepID=UPI003D8CC010
MHLADILALRPVPAAALLMAITRRCPLTCAHCSTSSLLSSEEHPAEWFSGFVETIEPEDRPELIMLTGGEPMLRPRLVSSIASAARSLGTRTMVLTGGFFAPRVPPALDDVAHVSVSLDVFHQREVPRENVFRLVHVLAERGVAVSFHVVGSGPDDPYLTEVIETIRREFRDGVPILVGRVRAAGRARAWATADERVSSDRPRPCTMAAWPTVSADGTIAACCNQDVLDHRPIPGHLRLGHVSSDSWRSIRTRCRTSPLLRAIRTGGPQWASGRSDGGYCGTCRLLGTEQEAPASPAIAYLEQQVIHAQLSAGPAGFMRRYGEARFADLVMLGR